MAEIKVTPKSENGERKVLVNGVAIPDVTEVSLLVRAGYVDEVAITVHADSFQLKEK